MCAGPAREKGLLVPRTLGRLFLLTQLLPCGRGGQTPLGPRRKQPVPRAPRLAPSCVARPPAPPPGLGVGEEGAGRGLGGAQSVPMGVVRALVTCSSSDHGARPLGCGQRGDQEGGTASRPAPAAAPGRSPAPSVAHSRHAPHRGLVSGIPPSPTLPVLTTLKGRGGGPEPGRHSSAGEGTWGVTAKPRACGLRVLPWSPPLWPPLGATSGLSSPLARRGHAGDSALGPAGRRGGGSCLRPRPHQHGQDACRRGWWPTSRRSGRD